MPCPVCCLKHCASSHVIVQPISSPYMSDPSTLLNSRFQANDDVSVMCLQLACARIGAVHSVVFAGRPHTVAPLHLHLAVLPASPHLEPVLANPPGRPDQGALLSLPFCCTGFSAEALAGRLLDSKPAVVLTASASNRATKPINLKVRPAETWCHNTLCKIKEVELLDVIHNLP